MHLTLIFLLRLWLPLAAATPCVVVPAASVLRALDGDTVRILIPGLPAPLDALPMSLRVRGVDCAETGARARCEQERAQGESAKAYTHALIEAPTAPIRVEICGWDKYGGRVLGDVLFGDHQRLSAMLLETRNAVPYSGRGQRHAWCDGDDGDDDDEGDVCAL